MSRIIHRSLRGTPPVAAGGRGIHLFDSAGKAYIDASGGAAVSCLGHAHPDVLAAMHAQIDRLAYAHTGFFTSEAAEALADHLVAHAPAGLDQVYFVSGGSEAMEAALKLHCASATASSTSPTR
jgi:adenosylmethionine-8-amino-7-oxononanoate aminotransferase